MAQRARLVTAGLMLAASTALSGCYIDANGQLVLTPEERADVLCFFLPTSTPCAWGWGWI